MLHGLNDLRVIDFSDNIAGSYATRLLADAGAEVIGADATDPSVTTAICAGADVIYFCLNAVHYERWVEEFPPLQRGVLAGAERADARLVVLDNLYAYGPPHGRRGPGR